MLFHYGLSQDIEDSPLCYTVGPCLSNLYIIVCIWKANFKSQNASSCLHSQWRILITDNLIKSQRDLVMLEQLETAYNSYQTQEILLIYSELSLNNWPGKFLNGF